MREVFLLIDGELFLFKSLYKLAVLLVVGVILQILVEVFLGFLHVFLIEIVVAHVVVHLLGIGSIAGWIFACLKKGDCLSIGGNGSRSYGCLVCFLFSDVAMNFLGL